MYAYCSGNSEVRATDKHNDVQINTFSFGIILLLTSVLNAI